MNARVWVCVAGFAGLLAACTTNGAGNGPPATRISGGFPIGQPDRRLAHAVQVRITDQALRNVEAAGPDLLAAFVRGGITIPRSEQQVHQAFVNCTAVVCPNGCTVPVTLATTARPVELAFVEPDQLRATVRLTIPLTNIPIEGCSVSVNFNIDTTRGTHAFVGLQTRATVHQDTHGPRMSYFGVVVDDFAEAPNEEIENEDFECRGSGLGRVLCGVINNFFRDTIRERVRQQFATALEPIRNALTERANPDPPGCPTGTLTDGVRCMYSETEAVPVLLGIDGETTAASLGVGTVATASGAPFASGRVSYVLAAGDPYHSAEATARGITLNALGAVVARAHSPCVPSVDAPRFAPTIPEWTTLRQNVVPNGTAVADIALGVSEDFLNRTLWSIWEGGLLCRERDSSGARQIADAILAAVPAASPLRGTVLPGGAAPIALTVHPQRPPHVTLGRGTNAVTDPLVRLEAPQVLLELFDVHAATPVRIVGVTVDLALPMGLTVNGTELRPVAGALTARNIAIAGATLTPEQSAALSALVESIVAPALARQIAALLPVTLPAVIVPGPSGAPIGSFQLAVLPNGVQGIAEGTSRFLGVWASVQYRSAGSPRP